MILGLSVCRITNPLVPMLIGHGFQGIAIGIVPLAISLMRGILSQKRLSTTVSIILGTMGVWGIGSVLDLLVAAAYCSNNFMVRDVSCFFLSCTYEIVKIC